MSLKSQIPNPKSKITFRRERTPCRSTVHRGVTFVELIITVAVMGMALLGLMSLWEVAFNFTTDTSNTGIGFNLGRHMMERLKEKGFFYLRDSNDTVTRYFKETDSGIVEEEQLTAESDFRVKQKVDTGNLTANSDASFVSSLTPNEGDLRRLQVKVYALSKKDPILFPEGEIVFDAVTYLAKGGR